MPSHAWEQTDGRQPRCGWAGKLQDREAYRQACKRAYIQIMRSVMQAGRQEGGQANKLACSSAKVAASATPPY